MQLAGNARMNVNQVVPIIDALTRRAAAHAGLGAAHTGLAGLSCVRRAEEVARVSKEDIVLGDPGKV